MVLQLLVYSCCCCYCCCVVDTGHQCVRIVQIMRWWYSNLENFPSAPRLWRSAFHFNYSFRHTFFFLRSCIVRPPHPLFYCLPIRSRSLSKPSRFTRSLPLLLVQSAAHLGVARTRPPLSSAARPCTPRSMPVSAFVPVPSHPPPFASVGLHPGPCQPLVGVCSLWVPLRLCVPASPSLRSSPNLSIVGASC